MTLLKSLSELAKIKHQLDEVIKEKIVEQYTLLSVHNLTIKMELFGICDVLPLCERKILEYNDCIMDVHLLCNKPVKMQVTYNNVCDMESDLKEVKDLLGY